MLVYSDDRTVRSDVLLALGKAPVPGLPEVTYLEVATEPALVAAADAGGIDLFILDGEAVPACGQAVNETAERHGDAVDFGSVGFGYEG